LAIGSWPLFQNPDCRESRNSFFPQHTL